MNLDPNMKTRTKFCLTAVGAATAAVSGASADVTTVTIDISGTYDGTSYSLAGLSSNSAWASATILNIAGNVSWEAFDNQASGAYYSNYTNELELFALGFLSSSPGPGSFYAGLNDLSGGYSSFGSASGIFSGIVASSRNWMVNSVGQLAVFAKNQYNDYSNLAQGVIKAGSTVTFTIDTVAIPTPGALALLGVAGLAASRRRRNA
jgi:uncharacterized protein (TIGR03382 family)